MLSGSRIFMIRHLARRGRRSGRDPPVAGDFMALIAAALAAIGYAAASVLQSRGALGRGSARELARSPFYLAGLALDAVCWVLTLIALRGLPVYVVQAVLASSLAFTVVLS